MNTKHSAIRDQVINIRANRLQRDVIDEAAQAVGKSRSEFMLEAAFREAESLLLDRVYFRIDADAFDRFNALLDASPAPSSELRRLLETPSPWE